MKDTDIQTSNPDESSTPNALANPDISGKLFDSGPRRSTKLAGESGHSTGSSAASCTGNGASHSSKYLGGSKLSSVAFRSVTFRKGQARGSESFDEGVQQESYDDSRTSTSSLACDTKFLEEGILMATEYAIMSESQAITGASDLIALLAILGEGYRLSCLYVCQDALDVYQNDVEVQILYN
ncbi:hypothetical protein POM88_022772 [Heracleum sosnowskyi]|uniref:Uncharacterized protein n=1 Tax=Heracleum sosnowskyi TaxID=360622 RepID=A0AAD8MU70_9APIA|nr:hypothetical protein POM88_022772 [Heracleum sosnowskyi]